MTHSFQFAQHHYPIDNQYSKKVAYFSMEFAIDQALKIYSGGLGFLAGSHMRSAYQLNQAVVGVGILWKNGYYNQILDENGQMKVQFTDKKYHFLKDTGHTIQLTIQNDAVFARVWYLAPEVFGSAPIFLLSTDVEENTPHWRALTERLYHHDTATKVAQCMLLGIGGAKALEAVGYTPEIYHFNEAHAVSAAFYLYQKQPDLNALKHKTVFTTHTPEEAGNEKHDIHFLNDLGFFGDIPLSKVREITHETTDTFNHSLVALRLSGSANAVSALHGEVSRKMWQPYPHICSITHITNAQNESYWADATLLSALAQNNDALITSRKKELKAEAFDLIADRCGKIFNPNVLTLVWARRFAEYKRPDLLVRHMEEFYNLANNTKQPIQIIWAGKPYPTDYNAVNIFNKLLEISESLPNVAVLTGYELGLSRILKNAADVWLNTPIVTREASGTSGMTAAMNASLNFSTYDGWICEFARDNENSFIIPVAPEDELRDENDRKQMFDILKNTILPTYYKQPNTWVNMVKSSMKDVQWHFNSHRMAAEYYHKMYN